MTRRSTGLPRARANPPRERAGAPVPGERPRSRRGTELANLPGVNADVERLGAALDDAIRELSGEETLARVSDLRAAAERLRSGGAGQDARRRFAARIGALDDEA